ncbi:MAG: hypothetical protein KC416_14850, partial [Myxococcales bacterium]|nr:hypothetical protein [Myxococcales bacterium]
MFDRISSFTLVLSIAVLSACGTEAPKKDDAEACSETTPCSGDKICIEGVCALPTGQEDSGVPVAPPSPLESIRIEPDTATLTSTGGSTPSQEFKVIATYKDGTEATSKAAVFELDTNAIGTIDGGTGLFTANGVIGGKATVTATVSYAKEAISTTATLTVQIQHDSLGENVPADVVDLFKTVEEEQNRAANIVYPLDGAVMPQNVYPANIQWTRSAGGDFFRIRIKKPNVTVTSFQAHASPRSWLVDEDAWRSIAQTDVNEDATITVDRYVAEDTKAYSSEPVKIKFAKAALTGAIYYWDIGRGRIVRINDGTAVRDEFMPNPSQNCVGCHAVSPSGRYMIGRHGGGDNVGTVYDLTKDLTANPAVPEFPLDSSNKWWGSTWAPDEARIAVVRREDNLDHNRIELLDPTDGSTITHTGTAPSKVVHPSWSPDGTQIALIANTNSWGGG